MWQLQLSKQQLLKEEHVLFLLYPDLRSTSVLCSCCEETQESFKTKYILFWIIVQFIFKGDLFCLWGRGSSGKYNT